MRLILALWLLLSIGAAGADFSGSSIAVSPEAPDAGDVITYDAILRNGGADVPYATVAIELSSVLLLGMEGDCRWDPAEDRWIITDWAAGDTRRCTIETLSFAHDAGSNAKLALDIRSLEQFWRLEAAPQLDTPPALPQLLPSVLWVVAAALLIGTILWAVWLAPARTRRRTGPAITIALGSFFFLFFADLAWRDWRAAIHYRETDCVVVGATLDLDRFNSTTPRIGRNETATPLLALRYTVDGRVVHAMGFAGPSHLLIGGGGGEALASYALGDAVPCRYDPDYPRLVLVRWEPGFAYLLAVLPLLLVTGGVMSLRRPKSR